MAADIKKALKKDIKNAQLDDIKTTKQRTNFFIPFMLMIPALIFFVLFTFIPLFKVIFDSTRNDNPNYISTYANVWTDGDWYLSIFNSFVYAIISVPLTLCLALIISFAISNIIRTKFRGFWQTIFFLPYVTSTVAISIVFSQLFSSEEFGIINWILGIHIPWLNTTFDNSPVAFIPVIIFGVWHSLAFKVLILTSAMLAIDKRLYDAASIDGASKKDMFFTITLPAINSTIWYLITIGLIGSMKVFPLALFDNSINTAVSNMPTMMTYVYQSVKNVDYGKAGAASVSLIFVVIIMNWIIRKTMFGIQRFFTEKKQRQMKKEINNQILLNEKILGYNPKKTESTLNSINKHIDKLMKELGGDA